MAKINITAQVKLEISICNSTILFWVCEPNFKKENSRKLFTNPNLSVKLFKTMSTSNSSSPNAETLEDIASGPHLAPVAPGMPSVSTDKLNEIKARVRSEIVKRKMEEDGLSAADAEKFADNSIAEVAKKTAQDEADENAYMRGEFDHDFLKVYMNDTFLGTVSLGVTKVADFKMPTAYVGARPNGKHYEVVMGFNPNFFRSLSPRQRQGVIKHEMYHLIFQHIFERAPGDKHYQTLWNWATDLAINSIIGKDNLPDACLIPGHRPTDPATGKPIEGPYAAFIEGAKLMESSDWYFEELRKIEENERSKGNNNSIEVAVGAGMNSIDDHGKWGDLPAEVREQIRDKVRDMIEKAVKKAERTNDWGSVPHEIQEIIRKILSHDIDWRSIVRQFIGRCRSMERISTIKRINKKAPYLFPGYKRKYIANFAVFIDQSGSMSDGDISMLFSELETFANLTALDVYHFDTEIDEKSKTTWKRGRQFPPAHRTRCGGTDFQAVANFLNRPDNRGKWSGAVILTDGYAPVMGQVFGTRICWVITEGGSMDAIRPNDLAVKMKAPVKTFKRY